MLGRDYAAWGTVIGKLAALFPHLVAIEIDDFTHDVAPPSTTNSCEPGGQLRPDPPRSAELHAFL